jgi:hypothetical protein
MSLVLLPGMMAAGIGSLVFIGLGDASGLSTDAWELIPPSLPPASVPDLADFAWTLVLAVAAAIGVFIVIEIGRRTSRVVGRRPVVVVPIAGVAVASLAIAFHETTDASPNAVLFSGETSQAAAGRDRSRRTRLNGSAADGAEKRNREGEYEQQEQERRVDEDGKQNGEKHRDHHDEQHDGHDLRRPRIHRRAILAPARGSTDNRGR